MATKTKAKTETKLATTEKKQGAMTTLRLAEESVNDGLMKMADMLSREPKPGPLVRAFHLIDKSWLKAADDMKKFAREKLLDYVEEHGDLKDEGPSKVLTLDSGGDSFSVERRVPVAKAADQKLVLALLEEKGVKLEDACDVQTTVTYTPNPAKLMALVDEGVLTDEELTKCKKPGSPALWVVKL